MDGALVGDTPPEDSGLRNRDHEDEDEDFVAVTTLDTAGRLTLYATQFVDTAGLTVFLPLLPYYFSTLAGFSASQDGLLLGLLAAAYAVGQLVGNITVGALSDRWGRRPLLVCCTGLGGAAGVYCAFAPSIWQLAVARLLAGLVAGTVGVLQAYCADTTSLQDRSREIGRLGACSALGLMAGPSLGIFLGYSMGVGDAFWLSAILSAGLCLCNMVAVILFLPESPRFASEASKPRLARRRLFPFHLVTRTVTALYVTSATTSFVNIMMESVLPLLLVRAFHYAPWQLIAVYGAFLVCSISIQGLVFGRLMNAVADTRNVVTACCAYGSLVVLAVPVLPDWRYTLCMVAALGSSIISVGPACSVMLTTVSKGRHGALLGGRSSVVSLARALSPLVNGPLYDVAFPPLPHALPFLVACAALLVSAGAVRAARVIPLGAAAPSERDPLIQ